MQANQAHVQTRAHSPDLAACSLPLLAQDECTRLCEHLLLLDAFWLARHPHLPFHTLGATNYYDLSANPARPYAQLARKYNPFLQHEFGSLYQQVLACLRAHLQEEVEMLEGAALPGFHIFGGDPAFSAGLEADIMHSSWFSKRDGTDFPGNPIHVDTAHLALGLPVQDEQGHKLRILSFTLALDMPRAGAGLRLWPLQAADVAGLSDAQKLQRLRATPSHEHAYQCGALFLHCGDYYHQARGLPLVQDEWRITLQGHGAWWQGRWQLFW